MLSALEFIWKVRNHLHIITGRKCDQLYFEHQEKLAEILGFKSKSGEQAVERFLGELHSAMDTVKQLYLMFVAESAPARETGSQKRLKRCSARSLL